MGKIMEMLKMGLTEERLAQMIYEYDGDIDAVYEVVDEWNVDNCKKGYKIFNYDGLNIYDVEAICDVNAFDDDEAVRRAVSDGITIIPVNELPENFDHKYYCWIDTPENRKAIQDYCDKYCEPVKKEKVKRIHQIQFDVLVDEDEWSSVFDRAEKVLRDGRIDVLGILSEMSWTPEEYGLSLKIFDL